MAKTANHNSFLEDEWYHVRYSGEIPEIALHSSLYHLTEDSEGPGIALQAEGLSYLLEAAKERYLEIVLRDITPANRDTAMYRGVLRTMCNWRRFKRFCQRHHLSSAELREQVVNQILLFLENEVAEVARGERQSCINCTFEEIASFAAELDFSLAHLEDDLRRICLQF